jgi:hypothetical protein
MSLYLIVYPISFKFAAILPEVGALPLNIVILKFSVVRITIVPLEQALTVFYAVDILPVIG